MSKDRLVVGFALVTVLGLAACGGETEEAPPVEEPAAVQTAEPVVDPQVYEGAIMMDTASVSTVPAGAATADTAN